MPNTTIEIATGVIAILALLGLTIYVMKSIKLTTKAMTLVSLFAALTAVGAFIKVPLPLISFSLQTFFVFYSAILLGAKLGMLSQVIYVLIGLIGVPIFTNGGGPSYVFQPSFGFLIGFIVSTFFVGKLHGVLSNKSDNKIMKYVSIFVSSFVGIIIVYLIGVPYLYIIKNFYLGTELTVQTLINFVIIPLISGDIVKAIIISLSGVEILNILKRANLLPKISG